MKKLIYTTFIAAIMIMQSTLLFAASSADVLTQDFVTYNRDIQPKIVDLMTKITEEKSIINKTIVEGKKQDFSKNKSNIASMNKELIKFMDDNIKNLKTPEMSKYLTIQIELVKLLETISNDIIAEYEKTGKVDTQKSNEITKKYEKQLTAYQQECENILYGINEILSKSSK